MQTRSESVFLVSSFLTYSEIPELKHMWKTCQWKYCLAYSNETMAYYWPIMLAYYQLAKEITVKLLPKRMMIVPTDTVK